MLDAAAAVAAAAAGVEEDDLAMQLVNRVPLTGQAAEAGEARYYRLQVAVGVRSLSLRTYGGSGDVSQYVDRERAPTTTSYALASQRPGNAEALVISNPAPGTYFLRVQAVAAANAVTVLAAY
ncbi:MAG: PPC domain-containing protein [Pseudoxanthomonas sp.]